MSVSPETSNLPRMSANPRAVRLLTVRSPSKSAFPSTLKLPATLKLPVTIPLPIVAVPLIAVCPATLRLPPILVFPETCKFLLKFAFPESVNAPPTLSEDFA